jgi:hypothetical protein
LLFVLLLKLARAAELEALECWSISHEAK